MGYNPKIPQQKYSWYRTKIVHKHLGYIFQPRKRSKSIIVLVEYVVLYEIIVFRSRQVLSFKIGMSIFVRLNIIYFLEL